MAKAQPQCSVYFCLKIIFQSWLFWLIWPVKCLILMILTMAKYHENLHRDSTLSLLSMVKFFSSLETKMIQKIPNETLLRITRYFNMKLSAWNEVSFSVWQLKHVSFSDEKSICRSVLLRVARTKWPIASLLQGKAGFFYLMAHFFAKS